MGDKRHVNSFDRPIMKERPLYIQSSQCMSFLTIYNVCGLNIFKNQRTHTHTQRNTMCPGFWCVTDGRRPVTCAPATVSKVRYTQELNWTRILEQERKRSVSHSFLEKELKIWEFAKASHYLWVYCYKQALVEENPVGRTSLRAGSLCHIEPRSPGEDLEAEKSEGLSLPTHVGQICLIYASGNRDCWTKGTVGLLSPGLRYPYAG